MHIDRIEVSGVRAVGTIGLLPEERSRPQPFEVDFVIELDARAAGATDNLELSVDYGTAIALVSKVIETEHTLLLERVANRIAEEILGLARVDAVEVVVRKLRPPVPHDVDTTAVRVRRRRADLIQLERKLTSAFIAIGSNLGDRREHLRFAVLNLPGVHAVSGVYETDPVGSPDESGPYLNMVVELETRLNPFELLDLCRRVELADGRERKVRWGARTLDLDVLLYDGVTVHSDELTIPHPRMFERRFVLTPLAEIAPDRCPKDWDQRLPAGGIRRVDDLDL